MSADDGPQTTGKRNTSPEPASAEQAITELQDLLEIHEQKRRLYPRATVVGALAGMLAVAFQWSLVGSEALRHRMIVWAHQYPRWGWILPMLVSAVGAGLAIWLVRDLAPDGSRGPDYRGRVAPGQRRYPLVVGRCARVNASRQSDKSRGDHDSGSESS